DAVIGHVILTVFKTAEIRFGLAQSDAVRIDAEGAGRHLEDLAKIGDGRGEVLNELRADLGFRGSGIERVARGCELGRERSTGFYRYGLGEVRNLERDR